MSKAIMITGTNPRVGKSLIVSGLCRIFSDFGINVAPFKVQDETMQDDTYHAVKDSIWEEITKTYDRLSKKYTIIVIEGAGNMAESDMTVEANMRFARFADAALILVGEVDKDGMFSSFYETVEQLNKCANPFLPPFLKGGKGGLKNSNNSSVPDYIKAFILNKFRGDINNMRPELRMLEDKTGKPVIGVVDYINELSTQELELDEWADILKHKVDMCFILRQVGMEACMKKL